MEPVIEFSTTRKVSERGIRVCIVLKPDTPFGDYKVLLTFDKLYETYEEADIFIESKFAMLILRATKKNYKQLI